MRTKTLLLSMKTQLAVAAAIIATSLAAATTSLAADVNSTDKYFIKAAYEDGLAEIQMSELAQSKTASAEVKAFAAHMATDHGAANIELKGIADAKSIEVPTSPSLIAQGKMKLDEAKSGADFDKAYAAAVVSDHKKAAKAFEDAASNATDAEVKAFAVKTLPTLQSHLSMAEDLQNKIGKP